MLRTTTARTFSTSQLPKVVRDRRVLYILTWKCASRHNGVQFCMSHLTTWLRTRRFSEPTFRPSGATNHWKNTVSRNFPTLSCTCIFYSSLSFSSLIFSLLLFSYLTLPTTAFPSVHIVGGLTSKLPSVMLFINKHVVHLLIDLRCFNCKHKILLVLSREWGNDPQKTMNIHVMPGPFPPAKHQ